MREGVLIYLFGSVVCLEKILYCADLYCRKTCGPSRLLMKDKGIVFHWLHENQSLAGEMSCQPRCQSCFDVNLFAICNSGLMQYMSI